MMTVSPARRVAFEILRRVEQEQAYASVLLAALDRRMREDDRALCYELVLGVLRKQLWLDRTLDHFAERKTEKLDLAVRLTLRLGLYQLRFLSRIPASAAVNESVNLVRMAGLRSAGSLVNAILRRATREPDYDPTLAVIDMFEKLAIETSHPRWMIERWSKVLGFDETAALARANNRPAPISFRFTAKAIQSSVIPQLVNELENEVSGLSRSKIAPGVWRIIHYGAASGRKRLDSGTASERQSGTLLRKLAREGLVYFQDEASQLVAHLVSPQAGDWVLDVCAAPGGKTTLVATLAPAAKVIGADLHGHRLRTLKELAQQQGIDSIELVAHDATQRLPFADASFDRVLVDAPCSGTGTLRHNPEIRWRLQPSDLADLSAKQRGILGNAAITVKRGGRLVYSTCSIEPEENETVVWDFLKTNPDFVPASFENPAGLRTEAGAIRTWPHRQDVDGFFVAVLLRTH